MPTKYLYTTNSYNTDEVSRKKPISELDINYTKQLFRDFNIKFNSQELTHKLKKFTSYSEMERWRTNYIKEKLQANR